MRRARERTPIGLLIAGLFAVGLAVTTPALAQVSTSTIKGRITSGTATAQSGLAVTAVNKETGKTYRTVTVADGRAPGLERGRCARSRYHPRMP